MLCRSNIVLAAIAIIVSSPIAFASGNATFQPLPNTATDADPAYCAGVSADGLTVYGEVGTYGSGWYWTAASGLVDIGGGRLCGAANGPTRICGLMGGSQGMDEPGIWTITPYGWTPIGGLPGSPGCGSSLATPFDMSRDGTTVGGLGWAGPSGCKGVAFKWTQAGGMVELPMIDGANHYAARVNAVSGNGAVFGGWEAQTDGIWRPVVWQNGQPTALAALECDCGDGEMLGLNYNGAIGVGYEQDRAFVWTPSEGMTLLANPRNSFGQVYGMSVSDNGRVIAGHYGLGPNAFTAVVWIDRQPSKLQDYLIANGATGLTGWTLWTATGVSSDGTTIVGTAIEPGTNHLVPYRATIPSLAPLCPADIDGSHAVDVNDLLSVVTHWGACPLPCPPKCAADIVADCSVNVNDLLAVITSWGACH